MNAENETIKLEQARTWKRIRRRRNEDMDKKVLSICEIRSRPSIVEKKGGRGRGEEGQRPIKREMDKNLLFLNAKTISAKPVIPTTWSYMCVCVCM